MNDEDCYTVIVSFETQPETQPDALEKIGAYIGSFLSQQPGFVESYLHASLDGASVVHYARWASEGDFAAAGAKARSHPDLPALMAYQPSAQFHKVWKTYKAPAAQQ